MCQTLQLTAEANAFDCCVFDKVFDTSPFPSPIFQLYSNPFLDSLHLENAGRAKFILNSKKLPNKGGFPKLFSLPLTFPPSPTYHQTDPRGVRMRAAHGAHIALLTPTHAIRNLIIARTLNQRQSLEVE